MESKFKNIDTELFDVTEGNVVEKKRNIILPSLLMAVGVVLVVVNIGDQTVHNTSPMMFYSGAVFALVGFFLFFILKSSYIYAPTGNRMTRCVREFDISESNKLEDCLKMDDFSQISELKSTSSGATLVAYMSIADSVCYVQAQKYVPYQYEPTTDVHKLTGETADKAIVFLRGMVK